MLPSTPCVLLLPCVFVLCLCVVFVVCCVRCWCLCLLRLCNEFPVLGFPSQHGCPKFPELGFLSTQEQLPDLGFR